jgi:uncharacterized protein YxjI
MNEINVDAKFLTIKGKKFSRTFSFLDRIEQNNSNFVVDKIQKTGSINSKRKNSFHVDEEISGNILSEIFPLEKDENIEQSLYEIISHQFDSDFINLR